MSSIMGKLITVCVFGESHGRAIGAVIDGLPAGEQIDEKKIAEQMERRAPGRDKSATPRKEADLPMILSGMLNGKTTGMPLAMQILNGDTRSADYEYLKATPRPSHADYPAMIKYGDSFDIRGSGHFSGRLTAPIVFAGSVCRQILERRGITVGGHIYSIGKIKDTPFDAVNVTADELNSLNRRSFSVISSGAEIGMREEIEKARLDSDSVGGVVEIAVCGLPVGLGEPMLRGVESAVSAAVFGIPAVKGIEFGAGFKISEMRGSAANDAYIVKDGRVCTASNSNGGILGGITTSMPMILRAAIKPTPSIAQPQSTLSLETGEQTSLTVKGRHDPCIVPRAVAAVEAAVCVALLDLMKESGML